jgi:hypothetical protein
MAKKRPAAWHQQCENGVGGGGNGARHEMAASAAYG